MAKELGKIDKPSVDEFKPGRKLYLVPLVYRGKKSPDDYLERFNRYWNQVENQIGSLERKLGKISRIYHELISTGGEDGVKILRELNDKSYEVVKNRLDKGAKLEATEEAELLAETMDWGRCLAVGLQSKSIFTQVYGYYTEVSKKRNEYIAQHINETLKVEEIGVLFIRPEHQVQFPSDIQLFYVTPPALNEIECWFRDQEIRRQQEEASPEGKPQ
ncbi:MAG: hypothetical protein J7K77_02145 [Dehalococcoidales bacterium]|nr:hypothetical protein [Dehalococcoidales bacterium]